MPVHGPCAYLENPRGVIQHHDVDSYSYTLRSKKRRLEGFIVVNLEEQGLDASSLPIIAQYLDHSKGPHGSTYELDNSNELQESNSVIGKQDNIKPILSNVDKAHHGGDQLSTYSTINGPPSGLQSTTPSGVMKSFGVKFSVPREKNILGTNGLHSNDTSTDFLSSTASTACTMGTSPCRDESKTLHSSASYQSTIDVTSQVPPPVSSDVSRQKFDVALFSQSDVNTTRNEGTTNRLSSSLCSQSDLGAASCLQGRALTALEKAELRAIQEGQNDRTVIDFLIDDGYIVTPGKHRIHINSFLMDRDQEIVNRLRSENPGMAAMACYAQDIYLEWRSMEGKLDTKIFQLSFKTGSDVERFRQMAIQCILLYVNEKNLSSSTAHCSIHNVHRVLLYYAQQSETQLTANMFFGTIAACVRMALKHEETPEKTRCTGESPAHALGKHFGLDDTYLSINATYFNKIELQCLKILEYPLTPPSSPDYLDRYLNVGGWPLSLHQTYREIAMYLTNLALFSRRSLDQLGGIRPSLLAAGALALGIKVVSAGKDDGYEFWPTRLVVYSGYSIADLRPAVRGLSTLLRSKPPESNILEHFHPLWARCDWK